MENNELEDLLEKKRSIEEKIREIRGKTTKVGNVSLRRSQTNNYFQLSINKQYLGKMKDSHLEHSKMMKRKPEMWISIAESYSKEDLINVIPMIIDDLANMFNLMRDG